MSELTSKVLPRKANGLGKTFLRLAGWTAGACIVMAVMMAAAVAWLNSGKGSVVALEAWLAQIRPYASVVRIGLIGALWWKWNALIERLDATGRMHPAMKQEALASRHRIVLLLLAVELFVVIDFPFTLLK